MWKKNENIQYFSKISVHAFCDSIIFRPVNFQGGRPKIRDITLEISGMFVSYIQFHRSLSTFHFKQNEINPRYFDAYMRLM